MFKSISSKVVGLFAVALTFMCAAQARADVALPTPLGEGVTLSDYISTAITTIGAVVATALGGYFAFKIIKKGIGWIGRALG